MNHLLFEVVIRITVKFEVCLDFEWVHNLTVRKGDLEWLGSVSEVP